VSYLNQRTIRMEDCIQEVSVEQRRKKVNVLLNMAFDMISKIIISS
jgi:hypothetical protein